MALWRVSSRFKKSVYEREFYTKDGQTIIIETGFRWGSWFVETASDTPPVINGVDDDCEEETDMLNFATDDEIISVELDYMSDGWYNDIKFPDGMSEDEQEKLTALWEAEWSNGLESEGWLASDCEQVVYGPTDVERVSYE